jgi:hypothetical protein
MSYGRRVIDYQEHGEGERERLSLGRVVIRSAGDLGVRVQLAGDRFTSVVVASGIPLATSCRSEKSDLLSEVAE